jgi:thiol-disulfide isomerase/thioredoxin
VLPDSTATVRLSSFRGKTVILNFWTKTCQTLPRGDAAVAELAKVARRSDFVVVTVTTDENVTDVGHAQGRARRGRGALLGLLDPESKVVGEVRHEALPGDRIVDPKGIIRRVSTAAQLVRRARHRHRRDGAAVRLPVEFAEGNPKGKFAAVCSDDS